MDSSSFRGRLPKEVLSNVPTVTVPWPRSCKYFNSLLFEALSEQPTPKNRLCSQSLDAYALQETSSIPSPDSILWPQSCRYLNPRFHDFQNARFLLFSATTYLNPEDRRHQQLTYVDLTQCGPSSHSKNFYDSNFLDAFDMRNVPPNGSRVFFIPQKRLYPPESTTNTIQMTMKAWVQLLELCMIPSFAMESLHDNNGALSSHLSYCLDGSEDLHPHHPFSPEKICAYHICLKLGDWGGQEYFVYARHDFHTETNLVLVMGTDTDTQAQRLRAQFEHVCHVHLFSILLLFVTSWARKVDEAHWKADLAVQKLESETGYVYFRYSFAGVQKPKLEQLSLQKQTPIALDMIRTVTNPSRFVEKTDSFLSEQVPRFNNVFKVHGSSMEHSQFDQQLIDTIAMHQSQTTAGTQHIAYLSNRAEETWRITNALLSEHNNRLNVEMAKDSRTDSILMRRIAFITIVFLPATFMATFFSMAFFQTDHEALKMSSWIWLYFAITVPITLLLAQQYAWPFSTVTGLTFNGLGRKEKNGAIEDSNEREGSYTYRGKFDFGQRYWVAELGWQVIETRKGVLGHEQFDTLGSMNSLAFILREQDKKGEAIEFTELNLFLARQETISTTYTSGHFRRGASWSL